jgi:hypothetical protein
VTSIGDFAFSDCKGLTSLTYEGTSDPGMHASNVFSNCPSLLKAKVPNNYKDKRFCDIPIEKQSYNAETTEDTYNTNTPIPVWNGEWADEPGVIIKEDNDIPMIKDTHYPLQTDYIRTSIPTIVTVTNISIGAIVMAVVIVSSMYNFVNSAQKLKELLGNGKYDDIEVNSDEFLSHSSSKSKEELISQLN